MLSELRVSELGVIEELSLLLGPGMTAFTGETGAGKTLVVEALELLVGGRAEPILVRAGAAEAAVEGRFELPGNNERRGEVVLARVVPAQGRARAYIDGRMATATALGELAAGLVDLHGQHAHQSLFSAAAQREALDTYSATAPQRRTERDRARYEVRRLEGEIAQVGGGSAAREREMELLAFQLDEIRSAQIQHPDEDDRLAVEQDTLAQAASHRAAALAAYEELAGEDQVLDRLGSVVGLLSGHRPLAEAAARLRGLTTELADAASELRAAGEALEEDPQRLAEVMARRARLRELERKYAGGRDALEGVLAFVGEATSRLAELEGQSARAATLTAEHAAAVAELERAARDLGTARRAAAGELAAAVQRELRDLAMPKGRFEIGLAPRPGGEDDLRALAAEDVTFMLGANPGEPLLPLSRVASGGELARAMLALRLVLSAPTGEGAPRTLVFDEVDAGVGGEAALAVGRALAQLGQRYQVIVVTHLPQVAACADAQVAVTKSEVKGRTRADAQVVTGKERVVELSRMLSGQPDSATAQRHAEELLCSARKAGG